MMMPGIFRRNLFDGFFDDFDFTWPDRPQGKPQAPGFSVMRTDVKEHDGGFDLTIDMPGYRKEDITAELKDGYLTVNAETKSEEDAKDKETGKNGKYIRRERYYGRCSRTFYVGEDITQEDIKAKFENGTLNLFIPKKEAQPKVEEKKTIMIEG